MSETIWLWCRYCDCYTMQMPNTGNSFCIECKQSNPIKHETEYTNNTICINKRELKSV